MEEINVVTPTSGWRIPYKSDACLETPELTDPVLNRKDGNEIFSRIKKSTQLKELVNANGDSQSVEKAYIAFLFDGCRLRIEQILDEMNDVATFMNERSKSQDHLSRLKENTAALDALPDALDHHCGYHFGMPSWKIAQEKWSSAPKYAVTTLVRKQAKDILCIGSGRDMYKNHLQELAERSCFNLPSFACIREGPDKASVKFNGEIFDIPSYYTTLRQDEHAAAEVALNVLSTRVPSRSSSCKLIPSLHSL
ncbi:hypothetical protein RJ640_020559 [Escallonia rubra]|uniref:DRBM domain-containing protein n=1 Tax=Escallonia rubra TaxID=112253 RepID=A0AA88QQS4_9ASTE|nr:hypothetical protein RJ640_020559 [Escallonia rubra]